MLGRGQLSSGAIRHQNNLQFALGELALEEYYLNS